MKDRNSCLFGCRTSLAGTAEGNCFMVLMLVHIKVVNQLMPNFFIIRLTRVLARLHTTEQAGKACIVLD